MSRLVRNGRNITGLKMIWSVKCILSCPTRSNFNKSYPFYRQIGFKIFLGLGFATFAGWHLQNIRPYCDVAALKGCHMTETERFVGNAKIRIINVSSVLQIVF